jgi:hypothetical protein
MLTINFRRLAILLTFLSSSLFIFCQSPSTYCYYPDGQNRVQHTGNLSFFVGSFSTADITKAEFRVTEYGKIITNRYDIAFTVDAPFPKGKIIDFSWTDNNTVRLYFTSQFSGRNSISVFITSKKNTEKMEYAGPITFVSSNNGQNPGYATICEKENYKQSDTEQPIKKPDIEQPIKQPVKKPDTEQPIKQPIKQPDRYVNDTIKWDFRVPRQILVKRSGPKSDVINDELLTAKIVPTREMLILINKLNPGFDAQEQLNEGASVTMPVFLRPDKEQVKNMEIQFKENNSFDEMQNALFLEKSKNFGYLFQVLKVLRTQDPSLTYLDNIDALLSKVASNQKGIRLIKLHAINLGSELEKLNNYLLKLAAQTEPQKINDRYIQSSYTYIYEILRPYFSKSRVGSLRQTPGSGLMSTGTMPSFPRKDNFFAPGNNFVFALHVFIPVPTGNGDDYEYKDSSKKYWVYCLSQHEFDGLNEELMDLDEGTSIGLPANTLNELISKNDLDKNPSTKGLASVALVNIDVTGPTHFVVVSDKTKEIIIHTYIEDLTRLPRHSPNFNIPESYGIVLVREYQDK